MFWPSFRLVIMFVLRVTVAEPAFQSCASYTTVTIIVPSWMIPTKSCPPPMGPEADLYGAVD